MPYLRSLGFKNLKVLITSGPTSVPIDDMRVITNRSTGELGRLLARALAGRGACVTLLEGAVTTALPVGKIKVQKFFEFNDLARALKRELVKGYQVVIHAAAVSDFELDRPFRRKIVSGRPLSLRLKPTRKLVNDIKRLSPSSILVAFKLESSLRGIGPRASRLFKEAGADCLVANCSGKNGYQAFIMRSDGRVTPQVKTKQGLVKVLTAEIDRLIKETHIV